MDAEEITSRIRGKWKRGYGEGRCPLHDDKNASMTIRNSETGTVLFNCHAGCPSGEIVAELRRTGVLDGKRTVVAAQPARDSSYAEMAMKVWAKTKPATGTLVETYLRSRGIMLPVPPCLRFDPSLIHSSGESLPAMVALVQGPSGSAIHRTWLAPDGNGKAPIENPKRLLGSCPGGAIQLYPPGPDRFLYIGEGIENALAGRQATLYPAWAAGSASALASLILPPDVRFVVILADPDPTGQAAAKAASDRWTAEEVRVSIITPERGDWNAAMQSGRKITDRLH